MRPTPFAKLTTRALTLASAILTLSACETMMGSGATEPAAGADTFCTIAKPITWSASDTDQTIREVKEHNAVGRRLCGWEGAS